MPSTLHLIFLLCLGYSYSSYAQIMPNTDEPAKQQPAKKTTKPAPVVIVKHDTIMASVVAPMTVDPSIGKFTLKIKVNTECTLLLDGENKGMINEDEIKRIYLPKGEYELKAKPTNTDYWKYDTILQISPEDIGREKIFAINMKQNTGHSKTETASWIVDHINAALSMNINYRSTWKDGTTHETSYEPDTQLAYDETNNQFVFYINEKNKNYGNTTSYNKYTSRLEINSIENISIEVSREKVGDYKNIITYPMPYIQVGKQNIYIKNNDTDLAARLNKAFHHLKEITGLETYNKKNDNFDR